LGQALLKLAPAQVGISEYLFGNILGLSDGDLYLTYGITLLVLPLLVLLQRPFLLMLFEPSIASTQGVPVKTLRYFLMVVLVLAMISSLRAVGIILALGTLIGPAATVYLFVDSFTVMFWVSGLLGAFASLLGLLVSDWTDLPAGACIVLVLGVLFLVSFLLSPRYGLFRRLRKGHLHAQSLARWEGEGNSER
jgi:ABC-type Mn2+/Zn2+ transport system permease subunit